jgi:hypothetical protein
MHRSIKISLFAFTPVFLALPLRAQLQEIVNTITLPPAAVPSQPSVTLPAFDPSLGVLRQVDMVIAGAVDGSLSLENTDASPALVPANVVAARITGTYPGGNLMPWPNPAFEFMPIPSLVLGAFDGTIDYAGSSGVTIPFQHQQGTGNPSITYPSQHTGAQLAPWVGPSGAPSTVAFNFSIMDISGPTLPPNFQEAHTLTCTVYLEVHYFYSTLPASICSSFSGNCPCAGSSGGGCGNSANTQGGLLSISGSASLSNDTLQLLGTGMTNNSALYFQGTTFHDAPTTFGDGLRCVDGQTTRLGTKLNVAGASMYPAAGDPSVSVRGGVTSPGVRYYQTYYRDAQAFCTSATFNITNGYAIQWGP